MERHGIFVETRLRKLLAASNIQAEVIAPVPWLPGFLSGLSRYSQYRGVPDREERQGITVHHPRYLVIPKLGMYLTPVFMAWAIWRRARGLSNASQFQLIDAHYYYPDGVAVAMVARHLKLPFLVTARGTDINLIPESSLPRKLILWAARKATASVTVCRALKDRMIELGASGEKIHVLRNGVDLELFRPMERDQCRLKFCIHSKVLVSVGHLIERKGHHLVIEAISKLPGYELLIAGDGEEEGELRALSRKLEVEDRVTFLGALPQAELVELYNAADALVLASSREGWANVLLEAMACGTPVVATDIWGTPELVNCREAGVLVRNRSAEGFVDAVNALFSSPPSREETREYAARFSWNETVLALADLMQSTSRPQKRA
jgi:glycosyltransferase involved in cell wall biosynthesis